jgi:hypothetical protein
LLKKLEGVIECGIPKGVDKYWEFALNPVNDLSLLAKQVSLLKASNLIPKGDHSLHITVGGINPSKKIYWVLAALELIFLEKSRIIDGFSKKGNYSDTWAKKGRAGIYRKNSFDLVDSDVGFEFRTLLLSDDMDLYYILKTMNELIESDGIFLNKLREEFLNIGLTDSNWETPSQNPDIWLKYVDNFDYLKKWTLKNNNFAIYLKNK